MEIRARKSSTGATIGAVRATRLSASVSSTYLGVDNLQLSRT